MAVTEEARHDVYTYFRETMGNVRAATLMELLPPVGWGDVATKQDLTREIGLVRTDLGHEIAAVRTDLGHEIAAVRTELGHEIASLPNWAGQHFEHIEKTMATKSEVESIRSTVYRAMLTQTMVLVMAMVGIAGLANVMG